TCHTSDVTQPGQTRTGKAIDPLALSATPSRFTDAAKVEKWFGRNCNSVLGRDCTAGEKADVLTWLASQ
ncbi:nitrate reductase, partial [Cereibacter changlensis JA139]